MKTCPRCGTTNSDGARFCSSCGAPFAAQCPSCGAPVAEADRYCPSCGARLAGADQASEERKLVTVLFADVSGSTALGERLDPERLRDVMGAYFQAMRAEIEAEGGTVEKFIGDAVMAAFGVPIAHEDDAARALRAAVRMQNRLEDLNTDLQRRHGVALQVRIGVNSGEAVAVTAPVPGEPMVSGDVVNVAARLQQAATPGTVVASERTAAAARGFSFRPGERLTLRGRSEGVTTFVLIGEAPGSDRGLPGLRAPLVGRDHELTFLRSIFDRTRGESRPHLVTVYGDPGIGKSRLIVEFLDDIHSDAVGLRVLIGRCLPYGEGVTYWPLAEILKSFCGILDSDPPELALEKIAKAGSDLLTEELTSDPARATAALANTVGLEDPAFDFKSLSPRQVSVETRAAWSAFFTALASDGPVAVVVEDIHWAEDALLDVLEALAEHTRGAVLFLCPARGELAVRRPSWGGGQRNFSALSLNPLTEAHADQMMRALLAVGDIPKDLRTRILERAEGNPFFLEEIIRKFIDEGNIVPTESGWRAEPGISDVVIPDTVQATLAARLDLLAPGDKRVVQFAAVVGRVFWIGPLASLLNTVNEAIEESLKRLRERDLVLDRFSSSLATEREYIFKHVLTRDVAYESLPRKDRPAAHEHVAHWIEHIAGDRKTEFIELLAYHYAAAYHGVIESGAESAIASEPLRRAAFEAILGASVDARGKNALEKAERLAIDALEIASTPLERSLAYEAAGDVYHADYRGDDAWRSFCTAVNERLDSTPLDRRAVAYLCSRAVEEPMRWPGVMLHLPSRDDVERYLRIGFEHLDDSAVEERVRLLTLRGFTPFAFFYMDLGDEQIEASLAAAEEAAELARGLNRPDLESASLDAVSAGHFSQGRFQKVLGVNAKRIEVVRDINNWYEVGDTYAMAADCHFHIGDYRQALTFGDMGVEASIRDAPIGGLHCLAFVALARYRLGDWDQALADFDMIVATMGDRELPPMPWLRTWAAAAFIHEARGHGVEADRLLGVIARLQGPQAGRSGTGASIVSLIHARRGDFAGARAWLNRLVFAEGTADRAEAECDLVAEAGDWKSAPQVAATARRVMEDTGCKLLAAFADRLEGRAALAAGVANGAAALLTRAAERFADSGAAWEHACTELDFARALLLLNRRDEALGVARSALEVFDAVGSQREARGARMLID